MNNKKQVHSTVHNAATKLLKIAVILLELLGLTFFLIGTCASIYPECIIAIGNLANVNSAWVAFIIDPKSILFFIVASRVLPYFLYEPEKVFMSIFDKINYPQVFLQNPSPIITYLNNRQVCTYYHR